MPPDCDSSHTLAGDHWSPVSLPLLIVRSQWPVLFDRQEYKPTPHAMMVGGRGHFPSLNFMSSKAQGVCQDIEASEVPWREAMDLFSLPCSP